MSDKKESKEIELSPEELDSLSAQKKSPSLLYQMFVTGHENKPGHEPVNATVNPIALGAMGLGGAGITTEGPSLGEAAYGIAKAGASAIPAGKALMKGAGVVGAYEFAKHALSRRLGKILGE